MDTKAFLQFAIQHQFLNKEQALFCLQTVKTSQNPFSKVLVEQGHFTPESLKKLLQKFQKFQKEQQQNSSGSKGKTNLLPASEKGLALERYEKQKLLGEGGMGVVYLAKDHHLEREIALKKMQLDSPEKNVSEGQALLNWRFQREAEITATLEHPNIVPIYDLEKQAGELYFTHA